MLTSGRKKSVQDAPTANDHDCNGCKANQAHTDTHPTKSEWDSSNAKLAKRSYGKGVGDFRGIVRFGKGWCGARGASNPSGSRPNFFGDSTSPLTRGGKNVVRSERGASNPSVLTAERFGE